MGKYQRFDDLPVWQEAARLYQRVLDVVEEANLPLSPAFRGHLERAALSVSSYIAESFDRLPKNEVISRLMNARGAAAEIQSMMAVVSSRPKVQRIAESLTQIRSLAESCARQLGGWINSVENGVRSNQTQGGGSRGGSFGPPLAEQGNRESR